MGKGVSFFPRLQGMSSVLGSVVARQFPNELEQEFCSPKEGLKIFDQTNETQR